MTPRLTRERRRRGLALGGLVVALACATPTIGEASATTRDLPLGTYFGINAQVLLTNYSRAAWQAPLDTAASMGMRLVRGDAPWQFAEPRAPRNGIHTFRWDWFDAVAEDLAVRDMRWFPVLAYSAPWAASLPGNLQSPPRERLDYAAFVGAFAERYGRGGAFWRAHPGLPRRPVLAYEIWNEPNLAQFWAPWPSARDYADLYLAARAALHAADREAVAVVGGLSSYEGGTATDFLREMYATRPELARHVDAIGLHPYHPTPEADMARVTAFRRALDDLGEVDVPIVVDEFGWSTGGIGALTNTAFTDAVRAEYLSQVSGLFARSDCGVGAVMPHTLVTLESNALDPEQWYGIVTPAGLPHASALAYAATVRALASVTTSGPVDQALCHRTLSLTVDAPRWRRAAHRRARCVPVSVRLLGVPSAGATVSFEYRRGRRLARLVQKADGNGLAEACFTLARGHRPARRVLRVTAVRADLIAPASTESSLLLP